MDSVNLGWFLLSQTIYSIGTFVIMSAMFQLRFRRHIGIITVISILNSVMSYLIYFNDEIKIGFVVPLIGILATFLYLAAVLKIPTIWSLLITVAGNIMAPLVIQLVLVYGSFGFFSPSELQDHIWRNYMLDITSGVVFSILAALLYLQGWNFNFDFDKIRLKWERYMVITISILAVIFLPSFIIWTNINDLTLSLTFLSISSFVVFIFLLGYALKKEQAEIEFLKPKEVKKYV